MRNPTHSGANSLKPEIDIFVRWHFLFFYASQRGDSEDAEKIKGPQLSQLNTCSLHLTLSPAAPRAISPALGNQMHTVFSVSSSSEREFDGLIRTRRPTRRTGGNSQCAFEHQDINFTFSLRWPETKEPFSARGDEYRCWAVACLISYQFHPFNTVTGYN